jgi:hypothetical protein
MTITAASKLHRAPDASYEVVANEAILIHLKTGVYYSLNEVGTAFWQLLDGARTVDDCARDIAAQSVDAPPHALIVSDLLELARHLGKEGLVSEA